MIANPSGAQQRAHVVECMDVHAMRDVFPHERVAGASEELIRHGVRTPGDLVEVPYPIDGVHPVPVALPGWLSARGTLAGGVMG